MTISIPTARGHIDPHRAGWLPNWKRLLAIVRTGAWRTGRWQSILTCPRYRRYDGHVFPRHSIGTGRAAQPVPRSGGVRNRRDQSWAVSGSVSSVVYDQR